MKALRNKSLMSLIYVALLSIPLVSILSRVIYVQANKNAYQSYSEKIDTETSNVSLSTTLIEGQVYTINPLSYTSPMNPSINYEVYSNQTNAKDLYFPNDNFQVVKITMATSSERTRLILTDENNTQHNAFNIETPFYFKSNGVNDTTTQNVWYTLTTLSYTTSKLDNVFEYSVSKLVDENNFGKLNFFTWFSDLLLDDAQMNMTFVRFANWYLCYALLISLMQILFLVLMWFVNFSRKLLDRGMNYDW